MDATTSLPTGTVTFLFTDIEGSTRLLQHLGERYPQVLADQRRLLRAAFQAYSGHEVKELGDGFLVAFQSAGDALAAAAAGQRALAAHPWPEGAPVRVRIGLHSGEPALMPEGYVGLDVHRAARINACGHGGQILLSQATRALASGGLPAGVSLRDLGAHRLKDLLQPEHLFQLVIEGLPSDFPPLNSLEAHPNNLPLHITTFIGREQEMAEIQALLARHRLVTLTGTGGTGKTRLALQIAADRLEAYPAGVWLVELAALAEPELVPQAVAGALHLREEPGRTLTETLIDYLKGKALLLLLDNCEHLTGACARLAETLVRSCPEVTLLATSREPLVIAGEHVWRVPSLLVPDPERLPGRSADRAASLAEYEGVRLFIDRAFSHQPRFAVTEQSALAVAEVCWRLDGLPLAIELAAARVKALPVEQIARRLDDRFKLLTGGSRTALPRQQTLRGLIDWSYELLSGPERALLRRLSPFLGGFSLEAVETVCAGPAGGPPVGSDTAPPFRRSGGRPSSPLLPEEESIEAWQVLDLLTALVEKSLVQYEEQEGEGRYRLLETIRQYGVDQLRQVGEEEMWRGRHRDYYMALAKQAGVELVGPEAADWIARLDRERHNLRAALVWTLAQNEADALLRFVGSLWRYWEVRGYWSEGQERLAEALTVSQNERTKHRAFALLAAGSLADLQGDYAAAWSLYEECLALYRELEDHTRAGAALMQMAGVLWYQGELPKARALYEEALEIQRTHGTPAELAAVLNNLAGVLVGQGEVEAARAMHEQSLAIRRPLGNPREIGSSLTNLGVVAQIHGDLEGARRYFEEALALYQQVGDRQHTATVVQNQGMVRYHQGDLEGARACLEESLAIRQELGDQRATTLSQARLALIAREQGDYERAHRLLVECFQVHQAIGNKLGLAEQLADAGFLALAEGRAERAARLIAAGEAQHEALTAALTLGDEEEWDRARAKLRASLGDEAFAAAWAEGRAMSLEQACDLALDETREG